VGSPKIFRTFKNFNESPELLTLEQLKSFSHKEQEVVKTLVQADVWWAAQKLFRSPNQDPLQSFHKQICEAMVQPNPDVPLSDWSPVKERAILAFRGALKTTLTSGYCVQCVLCAPDIRILFVGGTLDKAAELIDMVRARFNHPVIEYLFPEFFPIPWAGKSFTTPARQDTMLRDETLASTSLRAANAGSRCDLLILEDAATDQNMSTDTRVAKSVSQYDDLAPLVEAGGYTTFTGTRWHEFDIPASMKEHAEALEAEDGEQHLIWLEIPVFTKKENQPNQSEIDLRDAKNQLTPEDVVLTWEKKWNAAKIFQMYWKNPDSFLKQYLLRIPTQALPVSSTAVQNPTPELIHSLFIVANPPSDKETCVMNADLASVSEEGDDPCAIVSGIWNPGVHHLTVTGIILEKFIEEKAFLAKVTNLHSHCLIQSWNEMRFRVENVREALALWQAKFAALKMKVDFQYPSFDRGAREQRIGKLFMALYANQIHFDHALRPYLETIITQFCSHNPRQKQKHVDLLDSTAQLWEYANTIKTLKYVGFQLAPIGSLGAELFDGETQLGLDHEASLRADAENEKSAAEYFRQESDPYGRFSN
jgi:hypothetical protein